MHTKESTRENIIAKLSKLKAADRDYKSFGSGPHGYKLNPTLGLDQFEQIEEKYRCSFPEEYKHFITHIGNGGAGPSYGLFPIEQ